MSKRFVLSLASGMSGPDVLNVLWRALSSLALWRAENSADQLAGFAFHDSYHVGQMAYIRKPLGYPAVAG